MMNFEDSYFEDSNVALQIAKQQNVIDTYGSLQICYHSDTKLHSELQNLIYISLFDFADYLLDKGTRVPTRVVLKNNEEILLPKVYIKDLKKHLRPLSPNDSSLVQKLILELKRYQEKKEKNYVDIVNSIKKQKLDFNENLRIYIGADLIVQPHFTVYSQYQALYRAFKKLGYNVYYEESTQLQLLDNYKRAFTIKEFKPHIVININRVRNEFLNDATFNFIWFQDPTLILIDDSEIKLRKQDIVFHLAESLERCLVNKNIYSTYQEICIDTNIYTKKQNIARKKKIVFIGNSYKFFFDSVKSEKKYELLDELVNHYINNGIMLLEDRVRLMEKYNIINVEHVFNYVERDIALIYIANLDIDYELEIYGKGFENIPELAQYYKGVARHGDDVSKIYNTATYALSLTGYVMHYRVLESAASGCIPIVIDSRLFDKSRDFSGLEKSLIFMKKLDDLPQIIENHQKVDLDALVNKNSYKSFIERIVGIVNESNIILEEKNIEDTYFLDPSLALHTALKKNKVLAKNNIIESIQICYYAGELQRNTPKNCIHVPLENIIQYFSITKNRIPTKFVGSDKQKESKFVESLKEAMVEKQKKILELKQFIKKCKPSFEEDTLRIFAHGCRETVLIKDIQSNILTVAKKQGYEVYFHTQENEMQGCDELSYLEALLKFNPHITININHFNNEFLNEAVYNIVWFQDPRPILYNEDQLHIREKDFIFYTLDEFKNALIKKSFPKRQLYKQEFFTDSSKYFIDSSVKREDKVVFIGSYFPIEDDFFTDIKYKKIVDEKLTKLINSENYKISDIERYAKEFYSKKMITNYEHLNMSIYPTIGRREVVKWLCTQSQIKVEVYGRGWEQIKELKPFYKGVLKGKEINRVYSSSKYSLLIPSHSFYQQRLFEATLCGTITLAWNDPNIRDECKHKDCIVIFQNKNDLLNKLNSYPKKNIEHITNDISDNKFVQKIANMVKQYES